MVMKIQNNVFGPKVGLFIYFNPKIIACLNYGRNKTQTVLFWNWISTTVFTKVPLTDIIPVGRYTLPPDGVTGCLATLAWQRSPPPVPHLLWFWLKTRRKKVMKRWSKRGCLGLITKPDCYRCATNHLTNAKYKENQIIMGWKTSLWHICAGI